MAVRIKQFQSQWGIEEDINNYLKYITEELKGEVVKVDSPNREYAYIIYKL